MKNIFLTGGTGFIGSHLLERLIAEGYNVISFQRSNSNNSRISKILNNKNLKIINENEIENYFINTPPDIVLHLATYYTKFHTGNDIDDMVDANVKFPTKICQLCIENGVKYFINTGSFSEYDTDDKPLTEKSKEKCFTLYASTKVAFKSILKYYTEHYNFKALTINLFSPYGPKDNVKFIPFAIKSALKNTNIEIVNSSQKLNFTYVDDIVDAYMLALKKIDGINNSFLTINIADKNLYSLGEIINIIESIEGKKIKAKIISSNENEIWHSSFGSNLGKDILGWEAKTDIKEGILKTYNYYKKYEN